MSKVIREDWTSIANLSLVVKREEDNRVLQLVVGPGWNALALERPTSSFDNPPADGIGPHKHAKIGQFDSLPEALRAAERFAELWLEADTFEDVDVCACGPKQETGTT